LAKLFAFFFVFVSFFCTFAVDMLEKINGIVLRTVKFSDNKLIVDLFTLSHGRQSFATTISHSVHGRSQMAFWSPLSMVEFYADIRPNTTFVPKTKDVRLIFIFSDIPYNPMKSTISLFLAEFLSASLRDEQQNIPLYRYLETSLMYLDGVKDSSSIANFHLIFLLKLTRYIGILPNIEIQSVTDGQSQPLFDLASSTYTYSIPSHRHFLSIDESAALPLLFRFDFSTMYLLKLSRQQRTRFLEVLELYYRLHVPSFPRLKSIDVLHEIFS